MKHSIFSPTRRCSGLLFSLRSRFHCSGPSKPHCLQPQRVYWPSSSLGLWAAPAGCPGGSGTGTGNCGTCSATTVSHLSPRTPSGCACLALQGWRRGSEQVPCSSHDSTAGFSELFQDYTALTAGRVYPSLRGQPPALPRPPPPVRQGFIPQETRSCRWPGIN